ncbi:MAG: XcyI family restriction endonuclease [Candidatus Aminicenantales bacterium]
MIFKTPVPNLQIAFHARLKELKKICLLDALHVAVAKSDIDRINQQLSSVVSKHALRKVASWGIRGEIVFPIPYIINNFPHLLGYYRLLLGFSQKEFYGKAYGFSIFKSMEDRGVITKSQESHILPLCRTFSKCSELLIKGIGRINNSTIHELTLLTLGPQLRGGILNIFGAKSTRKIFDLIKSLIAPKIVTKDQRSIKIKNAAGRIVVVEFSNDPDICVREELPSGNYRNLVAIEIKGGRDISNIHNRIGEAEKSHQKARKKGYVECWTMVGVTKLDMDLARRESPSADRFYLIDNISRPETSEHNDFREHLLSRVGIKD